MKETKLIRVGKDATIAVLRGMSSWGHKVTSNLGACAPPSLRASVSWARIVEAYGDGAYQIIHTQKRWEVLKYKVGVNLLYPKIGEIRSVCYATRDPSSKMN